MGRTRPAQRGSAGHPRADLARGPGRLLPRAGHREPGRPAGHLPRPGRALRAAELRLGVLSDCTVELAETWPSLPLSRLVDAVVLSCETGRRKPDPELFHLIAQRLGVTPQECLYIGDGGGRELTGASACGMRAVMLRAGDWWDNDVHSREDDWPGPWISSLTETLDLVADGPAGR
ncbi:HAD family hydrolase [Nonomuraea zeae]|uniref:HAD family hydrolase n=1 Tax=Nonomuraea zeae TaxID=1642303 RepID=A0A5S4GD23_9ACTN|nr:HAD family hydrolase [Nonomuraea zeae]TMR30905.1 HAD family hydrolase [Nonomuraea zeae]